VGVGGVKQSAVPLVREFTERMLPLFDRPIEHAVPLRPVLERVFPMMELPGAHRLMESNETLGKIGVLGELDHTMGPAGQNFPAGRFRLVRLTRTVAPGCSSGRRAGRARGPGPA